jgi:polyisoprenoid-binding protein YceI
MKKVVLTNLALIGLTLLSAFSPIAEKLTSKKSHITFFSHTDIEDIKANNYKAVSTIETATGTVVFSVPMQSFEFEKALMQKHFNSAKFLDTQQFPKGKFVGKITNLSSVHFDKEGIYDATIQGDMTIHGETKNIVEKGTIIVKGNSVEMKSKFTLKLADYKIAFEKGKPSTNIAKTVGITVDVEY